MTRTPPLELYYHPLASYCWKVLVALYECDAAFEPHFVDLGDEASRRQLAALWPFTRFPVLVDRERGRTVAESSIIIEYVAGERLVPADASRALEVRFHDRLFDTYVHEPMQKIVGDRIRPPADRDPYGVARAREMLATAYALLERTLANRPYAAGDAFTMADCAAAPALHYANRVQPFDERHASVRDYLARLEARPSMARVLSEAQPYFHLFPG